MLFDLDLIERALRQAVSDAEDALAERHRNYYGYPAVGKFALYEDAVRDAKDASAEFNKMRKAMTEWRPIETAPKDGTWFYACRAGQPHTGTKVAFSHNCGGNPETWWDGSMFYRLSTFTHWMPLPPPPAEQGE